VRVADLLRGVIVDSGNDACVVFAEALAGSEEAFAQRMNEQAKAIGLEHSLFVNATGLPADPSDMMSVRDLATLARRIIHDYPEYYPIFAEKTFTFSGITQRNRNPLLEAGVPGVDGMKTGFTDAAGYGLVSSAERDGRRIVLVLAGLDSERQRRSEGERVLEYGFRDFQLYTLFAAGEAVATPRVWLGAASTVPLVADGPVTAVLSRDGRKGLTVKVRYAAPLPAPIAKGQKLGEIEIAAPGITTRIIPLHAADDVPKAGIIGRIADSFAYLVWGGG
jgi:D-alanyl-D-alanine carboxypeptidase (penicillin-binding protein 5/6)